MSARAGLAAAVVLAVLGFAVPALAVNGSVDSDGLPRLPQRPCQLRTDTMCKVKVPAGADPAYRIHDDGQFCELTIRNDGNLYDFYCALYWPFEHPVVNARLKPPGGGPTPWHEVDP